MRTLPLLTASLILASCGTRPVRPPPVPVVTAPAPAVRILTRSEYGNTIRDLLGDGLTIPPLMIEPRVGGFSTTGAAKVTASVRAVEQYIEAARSLARQVFTDEERRERLVGCVPAGSASACIGRYLERFALRAFRRPLADDERTTLLALVRSRRDAWSGLRMATEAILASPTFLYRIDRGRPQPEADGSFRCNSWELATRLSFFLWGTTPDDELLRAAARDELRDDQGVRRHAERLLASPRAREGLRTFFTEALRLDDAATMVRDRKTFKQMTRTLGPSMKEETLRVLEHNLETRGDFRTLLETRSTFVNGELAALYGLDLPKEETRFLPVTLPEGPRRGLLGHAAFLSGTSGVRQTSPTARGKYVREVFLCHDIPAPPPDVDADLPERSDELKTVRERLEDHRLDVGCNKCHELLDSIGLSFEAFNLFGEYRELDEGQPIDPRGELDGREYADPGALGGLLARDDRVPACMMQHMYRYATGWSEEPRDHDRVRALTASFRQSGYRLHDAILTLVTSEGFTRVR